jgi:hypothetical protein
MSFCKLSAGQQAALTFFKAIEAKGVETMLRWIREGQWDKLRTVAEAIPGLRSIPSIDDLSSVGGMSSGLRDAHFFLALTDVMAEPDAKSKLEDALDTCCWDDVVSTIMEKAQGKLHFSGGDLHQAYAPYDERPCVALPAFLRHAVQDMIVAGKLVGSFFTESLAGFFTHDLGNFFTGPAFDLCRITSGWATDQFNEVADSVESSFNTVTDGIVTSTTTVVEETGNFIKNLFG